MAAQPPPSNAGASTAHPDAKPPAAGGNYYAYTGVQQAYPNPAASQQTYPPQQPAGHPPQAFSGITMPSNVPAGTVPAVPYIGKQPDVDDGRCRCGVGWVMFGIGWVLYIPFLVGAFLPICDRSQMRIGYRRSAWIGNVVMSVIYTIWLIVVIALAAQGKFRSYGTYYCYGSYCY